MEQEQETKKENLENKVSFSDRVKYASIPAAFTLGACFIPELKNKYNSLTVEKQEVYRTLTLVGAGIFGAIVASVSGYNLFKNYENKRGKETEKVPVINSSPSQ